MFRVQVVLPIGRSLLGRGRVLSLTNKFCKRLSSTNDFEAEVSPESVGLSEVRLEHAFQQFEEDALSPPFSTGGSMVVSRAGKVCYVRSFGDKDSVDPVEMGHNNIFQIASMTKIVTSVAALMLVQEGKISLDDKISNFFPTSELVVSSNGDDPVSCKEAMTVRHVMSHTAGFSYMFNRRIPGDPILATDDACATLMRAPTPEHFAAIPLAFEPGSGFRYSSGTTLLGRVVEKVAGQGLDEFFHERIFAPLGMGETGFKVDPEQYHRVAIPQWSTGTKGKFNPAKLLWEKDTGAKTAGELTAERGTDGPFKSPVEGQMGLYTTPKDWQAFMDMLLDPAESGVLTESSAQQLSDPHTPDLIVPPRAEGDRVTVHCPGNDRDGQTGTVSAVGAYPLLWGMPREPIDPHPFLKGRGAKKNHQLPEVYPSWTRRHPQLQVAFEDGNSVWLESEQVVPVPDSDAPFNTHGLDPAGSGGHRLTRDAMEGGFAYGLGALVTISDDNCYGASVGSYGWEGMYCTSFHVDPVERLTVSWFGNVAPIWRYSAKRRILPLIYRALDDAEVEHPRAYSAPYKPKLSTSIVRGNWVKV